VINATTHQGAEGALGVQAHPIRRIGSRTLAVLIGFELLLLFGALLWALFWLTPAAMPFAPRHDLAPVLEAIQGSLSGAIDDPLIAVNAGASAYASNLRGLSMDGAVYYYYVEGSRNYDPLSRGAVLRDNVEVLLRDDNGPASIVVYRMR
jgi:hypothetical protein